MKKKVADSKPNSPKNGINANGELILYGAIGEWCDGLDAVSVINQLESMEGNEINIRIHSQGGCVMEGLVIYNRLKQSSKKINITIDALAASMASVIAMAGDFVTMPENAWIMIHRPWMDASVGNADSLREKAATLDRLEGDLVSIYQKKTGLSASQISKMLNEETWMNGEQALALGFIDEVLEPVKAAASLDPQKISSVIKPTLTNLGDIDMKTLTNDDADKILNSDGEAKAELKRINEIRDYGKRCNLDAELVQNMIDENMNIVQAREYAIAQLAERVNSNYPKDGHVRVGFSHSTNDYGNPYSNPVYGAFAEALACRHTGKKPSNQAAQYMNFPIVDMARKILEERGERTRFLTNSAVISKAMHTTSDFPELLTDTGNRMLLDAYNAIPSALKAISRKNTARDFRPLTKIQLTGDGKLNKVNEAGEFKSGTMFDSAESYKLDTFGQIFSISRQALVNDDLGAFSDTTRILGRVATDFESQHLVDLLTSNPAMSDNVALFHGNHNNLADSGGAIGIDTIGAGRQAMRLQKSINGISPISVGPRFLLVPAALETVGEQLIAQIYAATVNNANPFTNKLELLVEPRLDAVSATGWYLFADPAQAPVLEYAYLEGQEGPYFESRDGFKIDAMEMKLRLDFGAGLLDYRGGYFNEGAGGS